ELAADEQLAGLGAERAAELVQAIGGERCIHGSAFRTSGADAGKLPVVSDCVEDKALDEDGFALADRAGNEVQPILQRVEFGRDNAGEPLLIHHQLLDRQRLADLLEDPAVEIADRLPPNELAAPAEIEHHVIGVEAGEGVQLAAVEGADVVAEELFPGHAALLLSSAPGSSAGRGARPRIRSAAFSATMIVGPLVFAPGIVGITEASTTRSPSIPRTFSCGSQTLSGEPPIAQVPTGCWVTPAFARMYASSSSLPVSSAPGTISRPVSSA